MSSLVMSTAPESATSRPGDDAQQRRLARAGRTEQRQQRAVRHLEADVVEGDEVAEALGDVLDIDAHDGALGPSSAAATARTLDVRACS